MHSPLASMHSAVVEARLFLEEMGNEIQDASLRRAYVQNDKPSEGCHSDEGGILFFSPPGFVRVGDA
ncbi:MAG: hypothetical protein IPP77_10565 [Bacteroidetes bacterium]|nr:hypothetical protein [Bacteroidota bacterium]